MSFNHQPACLHLVMTGLSGYTLNNRGVLARTTVISKGQTLRRGIGFVGVRLVGGLRLGMCERTVVNVVLV